MKHPLTHRLLTILMLTIILASRLPQPAAAYDAIEKVQVKLGKPSVWSLAQAHYLLASMHKKNARIGLKDIDSAAIDPNAAPRPCGQFPEDAEKYRARFLIHPHILGSHKLDRDTITVTVYKQVAGKPAPVSEVIDIPLPVKPRIARVVNPETGKPAGYADQEVTAVIEGVNLSAIKKIFFGNQEAQIVGVSDDDSAIVKIPKLASLPKGETLTVPITLEMKSDFYEGKTVSAGFYKYIGEPLPIDVGEPVPVVVRPPRHRVKYSKNKQM